MQKGAEGMLLMLQNSAPSNEIDNLIQTTQARVENLADLIKKEEDKLTNISQLRGEYKEKLCQPKFGLLDTFDIEKCRLYCPTFSDVNDTTSLETFWKKLCCFAEQEHLSEKGVKQVLSCLLLGPAYETFHHIKDRSMKEIMQTLIDRYGSILTIADKLRVLESIRREKDEKLVQG